MSTAKPAAVTPWKVNRRKMVAASTRLTEKVDVNTRSECQRVTKVVVVYFIGIKSCLW